VTNADESLCGGKNRTPAEIVTELARRKARAAAAKIADASALIIAADTIVAHKGRILGKPSGTDDAVNMLSSLSGDTHEVYSGVAVVFGGKTVCGFDVTKVKFRDMDIKEITAYAATGDPLTKAGSYGAEGIGAAFIERIEGDFFNVAGLPVCKLANILKDGFKMSVFDLI